jgi:hypothetical protein
MLALHTMQDVFYEKGYGGCAVAKSRKDEAQFNLLIIVFDTRNLLQAFLGFLRTNHDFNVNVF